MDSVFPSLNHSFHAALNRSGGMPFANRSSQIVCLALESDGNMADVEISFSTDDRKPGCPSLAIFFNNCFVMTASFNKVSRPCSLPKSISTRRPEVGRSFSRANPPGSDSISICMIGGRTPSVSWLACAGHVPISAPAFNNSFRLTLGIWSTIKPS